MINISKKKLPAPVMGLFVYLSYCAMSWFAMRGSLAYYSFELNLPGWVVNDAFAFFLGGLMPLLVYEVLCKITFRMIMMRAGGDVASLKNGLDYSIIAANITLFLLKFIYIAVPLYAPVLNIIFDPVVTIGFVALYMWYAFGQKYIVESRYRFAVTHVVGTFLAFYAIFAFINIIVSVTG